MTSSTADTATIVDWLKAHPGLFRDHPELLDLLEFEHGAGTASLIERQVQRLREENRALKRQLGHLIGIAGENQRLVQRLHRLTLEVMATEDVHRFLDETVNRLKTDFHVDVVMVHTDVADALPGGDSHLRPLPAPVPEWLQTLCERARPLCGRLTRAKLQTVFGDGAESVASAALVPLDNGGLLAIGSRDPQRFFADMGTLFLELLGATIDFRLNQPADAQRKRA